MDIHYNAFISYRHHPDDIKVAIDIHRGLERFKVPKALKKQGKSITRLFRDKEELPITSSLTDSISMALENSDFLIVICSPHTKESIWVQREIETFLRTHSRDHVLTVLASGEPYDVIPDILLYEDIVNPITGQVERHEYEPLSCDWRLKKRKAVQEELPRLAAPLLGCGYDELRQRQRQYRTRRLVTLFSAALAASLCLTAYFINTSIQIQRANDRLNEANVQIQQANDDLQEANVAINSNLQAALRNQTEYLTSSANQLREKGDRLTAITLALAALPKTEGERPYLPAAELALSKALYAYQATTSAGAKVAFDVGVQIRDFLVSEDGKTLYILDTRKIITVWDTDTTELRHSFELTGFSSIDDFYVTAKGNVLVNGTASGAGKPLTCYAPDGTVLWTQDNAMDIAFLDDPQTLIVDSLENLTYEYLFLDPDTGLQVRQSILQPENLATVRFVQEEYSWDLPIVLTADEGDTTRIYALNLQTNEYTLVTTIDTPSDPYSYTAVYIVAANVSAEGDVLVMVSDGSGMMNGYFSGSTITSRAGSHVLCYDSKTGAQKWQSWVETHVYSGQERIQSVPGTEQVLCCFGNTIQYHDSTTGEVLGVCQTPAIPLTIHVDEASVFGILADGSYFSIPHNSFQCVSVPFVTSSVERVYICGGTYVYTPLSSYVTLYRNMRDENGKAFVELSSYTSARLVRDNMAAVLSSSILSMVDLRGETTLWQAEVSGYSCQLLGFSQDGSLFWTWENAAKAYDVTTGEVVYHLEIKEEIEGEDYANDESNKFLWNDKLLYMLEAQNRMQLIRLDPATQTPELVLELPELASETGYYSANSQILAATEDYVWIWKDTDRVCVIDLKDGKVTDICTGVDKVPTCTLSGDEKQVLLAAGSDTVLASISGNVRLRIPMGERKSVSGCFYEESLLVLCNDGKLYRYNHQGDLLSETGLQIYNTFTSNCNYRSDDPMDLYWWVTEDGELILNAFDAGNIIDTEHWQVRTFVPYLWCYDSQEDKIITYSSYTLYKFPRYSTQDLMALAQEQLGDFTLTPEQKESYGID